MLPPRAIASFGLAGLTVMCSGMATGQSATAGAGQAYPIKPIRIATAGVGGGNDVIARLIAQGISGPIGQQVIVDNRPTRLLPDLVAKAAPDGYTLMVYSGGLWLLPFMADVSYDPVKDFAPVTFAARSPLVVVVHPTLPVRSIKDLIALAKARPGELNFSTGGSGSSSHLAPELFKQMTGVNMVRIPYKSGAVEIADLIGGQLQLTFGGGGTVAPYVKSGRLAAIAVTSPQPSALFPGLPTVASSGLPGYESVQIFGLFTQAKTPDAVIRQLNQEIVKYLSTAETKERILSAGLEAVGSSPEEFAAVIRAEMARMGKVIRDAGIRDE